MNKYEFIARSQDPEEEKITRRKTGARGFVVAFVVVVYIEVMVVMFVDGFWCGQ